MRLSPLDCLFLAIDSVESPAHVGSLTIFDIPKGYKGNFIQDLKQKLDERQSAAFPFSHRLKPQGLLPRWPEWEEDVNFDLDFHLRHSGLPQPGTMKELNKLIARLHARQLDRSRPLWEFYLIEGLEGNRFATYQKVHHAMIDGMGGVEMLEQVMTTEPDFDHIHTPWAPQLKRSARKNKQNSLYEQLKKSTRKSIKQALSVPQAMAAIVAPAVGLKKTAAGKAFMAKSSPVNRRISASRAFGIGTLDLAEVKTVAKALDATVNDVFMTCCAGALARFAESKGELLDDQFSTGIPVALAREEGNNSITNIVINLHPNEPDPEQRLNLIQASAQDAKKDLADLSRSAINTMTIIGYGAQITLAEIEAAEKLPPPANLVISNVPGPDHALYFSGARLVGMYPLSVLMHMQSLNITVFSFDGRLDYSLLSTPEIMPQVQAVTDDLMTDYSILKTRAETRLGKKIGSKRPVRRARKTATKKAVVRKPTSETGPKNAAKKTTTRRRKAAERS